jgi:hypothetical protein
MVSLLGLFVPRFYLCVLCALFFHVLFMAKVLPHGGSVMHNEIEPGNTEIPVQYKVNGTRQGSGSGLSLSLILDPSQKSFETNFLPILKIEIKN